MPRLDDYLEHIERAAAEACEFVGGMSKEEFLEDRRTEQAVVMELTIIGEAATKIMETAPDFVAAHSEVPWQAMRGMRNRMVHGYFDINLDVVWDTVQTDLPALQRQMHGLRHEWQTEQEQALNRAIRDQDQDDGLKQGR